MSGSLKYWIRIAGDHAVVAKAIADAHDENTSMLAYNNENSLNCVIAIAYFSAGKDCLILRELPAGKGYVDLVFLSGEKSDKPAMIIDLKWNRTVDGAISQIKEK